MRGGALLLLILLACAPLGAHQQKAALTTVRYNPRSDEIEIAHRFYLHDAEHAAQEVTGAETILRSDTARQWAFARYVHEAFRLSTAEGQPLEKALVGVEVDGSLLWIYETLPGNQGEAIAQVRHEALLSLWPSQENWVNFYDSDGVRTLILRREAPEQALTSAPRRPLPQ
jgi:hypothetical protein